MILVPMLSGCNRYAKLVKKGTPEEKFAAANKYYNKKDYYRAMPLLEELIGTYKQKKESQEIYLMYAYCHYYMNEYTMASYHFKNFAETYSLNPKREEASFMAAKCEYHRSLPYDLDPTNTKNAIARLQLFVNQYPEGERVEECNKLMDELRAKLHEKTYRNAMLYLNIGDYKAAMVALQGGVNLYPDIPWKEEMLFSAAKAAYLYAGNSIEKMQKERYQQSLEILNNYKDEYRGTGSFQQDALKLEKKIKEQLEKYK